MRLAVMSYCYETAIAAGQLDTAGAIRHAHALGVEAVELMDRLIDAREVPSVRAALAETGSRVVGYDLADDVVMADASARRAAVERLCRGLERAAALEAGTVLLFAGRLKAGLPVARARDWLAEGLRACVEAAGRLGLTPTIENLGIEPVLCGTSAHLLDLCAAAGDGLRLTFDAGNFLLAGEDELVALERLWPRVAHVHLKDWRVRPPGTPPSAGVYPGVDGRLFGGAPLGAGVVNLPRLLHHLQQRGYQGYVAVEYEGRAPPQAAVAQGVQAVRDWLAGDGVRP